MKNKNDGYKNDVDNLVTTNAQNINNKKRNPKAVALLSGGLDSNLAIRLMQEQGVDVEAIAIKTPFCDFDCGKGCGHRVQEVAVELGIDLKTIYFGEEYLSMLKNPKYGYGSGMNPCIDCRSMMYNAAKDHMKKIGADFIITGEVLGQRPMSQNNNALKIIEKETGTEGIVLRPLSSKHLRPTNAEDEGLINRELLGNIKGRSRKDQLKLAEKYEMVDPPNAAGGCLLTDPAFSVRVRDLFSHCKEIPEINDIELLKVGRHFRFSNDTKLIVGRNKLENEVLSSLKINNDIIIEASNYVGPTCILRTTIYNDDEVEMAARIAVRYSDAPRNKPTDVRVVIGTGEEIRMKVTSIDDDTIIRLRI